MFLTNAWYVAAGEHEVARQPLAVTILGQQIVLYRTLAGSTVALENACPHRKLPLSMGRLDADEIECGYHGLMFDAAGRCTRMPGAARIPAATRVRSYPTRCRYGLVWIWMGAADAADPGRIFRVEHWDDAQWGKNLGGSMSVACSYLFVTDNLLDPTHVAWVHRSSFGNTACEEEPIRTEVSSAGVVASRWMCDVEVAPFYAPLVRFTGRCDRLQHYEVRFPSHALIRAVFAPAGSGGADRPLHADAMIMDSYNFITPVDAQRSRYFWFQLRNFAPDDAALCESMDTAVRDAFAEDRVILEAVQRGFDRRSTRSIDLAADQAGLIFRRDLAKLVAVERPI